MEVLVVNNIECRLKIETATSPYHESYDYVEVAAPMDGLLSAQVSWWQIWNALASRRPGCQIVKKFAGASENQRFDIDGITTIRAW